MDWQWDMITKRIIDNLGAKPNDTRMISIHQSCIPPLAFETKFCHDNGQIYHESYRTKDGIVNRDVMVGVIQINDNKWTTDCDEGDCPAEWLNDKLNKCEMIENYNTFGEKCRIKTCNISYLKSSGTVEIVAHVKWQLPNTNYWISLS